MLGELIQVRELKFLLNRLALMQRDIEKPFNRISLEKLYKALNDLPNEERLFLAKKYLNNSEMLTFCIWNKEAREDIFRFYSP